MHLHLKAKGKTLIIRFTISFVHVNHLDIMYYLLLLQDVNVSGGHNMNI
jgi:hypothetical protein